MVDPDLPQPARSRAPAAVVVVLTALALTVLDWPVRRLAPSLNVFDGSWHYVQHLWAHHEAVFTRRLEFPYGPLGFLTLPEMWSVGTGIAAEVVVGLLTLGVAAVLLLALRRTLPWWAAALLTLLVLRTVMLLNAPVESVPLAAAVVVLALPPRAARGALGWSVGFGVLTGVTLLVKFSDGVAMAGVALLAPLLWRRRVVAALLATVAAAVATLLVATLALTGGLTALPHLLSGSLALSNGYWEVTREAPADGWEIAVGVVAAVVTLVAVTLGAAESRRSRLVAALLSAWLLWLFVKHAFVRHDAHHAPGVFVAVAFLLAAVPVAAAARPWQLGRAGGVVVAVVLAAVVGGPLSHSFVDPLAPPRHLGQQTQLMVDAGARRTALAEVRRVFVARYNLPQRFVDTIGDATVQIDPSAEQAAWTYGLRLLPMPTVQTYTAFTAGLDRENAAAAAGQDAAEFVLRNRRAELPDHRLPLFDSPALQLAEVCHYRQVDTDGRWQLLQRSVDRCGASRRMATVAAGAAPVAVPAAPPGTVLVASFHVPTSLRDRLLRTLWRQRLPTIVVDGKPHAFVVGTASAAHVLVAPDLAAVSSFSFPHLRGVTVTFSAVDYR